MYVVLVCGKEIAKFKTCKEAYKYVAQGYANNFYYDCKIVKDDGEKKEVLK